MSKKHLPIYAAIIGKNEEKVLPRCLKSLTGFDGIYYTDTGSTDKSQKIALDYNCRISHFSWVNDFSKARNYNLDQIPKDEWVFIIDCDEWLPDGEIKKIRKAMAKSTTGHCFSHVKNVTSGAEHQHLRFFQNNIRYKDPAHTHIPVKTFEFTPVVLMHDPSPNHKKNPFRTLRILEAIKKPTLRETALLGREYLGFHRYKEALACFQKYLNTANLNQESAEVLLYSAQTLFQLKKDDRAKEAILQAIKFNPEYKEALIAMASFCNPWQGKAWLRYARTATNYANTSIPGRQDERIDELQKAFDMFSEGKTAKEVTLALKKADEKPESYYDEIYKEKYSTARYENIYKKVGELARGKTLDIGCGTGEMAKYIAVYRGFDLSAIAIKKANNKNCWQANAYDQSQYNDYETYIMIEVLEHLKYGNEVLQRIPKGKRVILTVPSFEDPAHIRVFLNFNKYKRLIDFKNIFRFNWHGGWEEGKPETDEFILLGEGIRI